MVDFTCIFFLPFYSFLFSRLPVNRFSRAHTSHLQGHGTHTHGATLSRTAKLNKTICSKANNGIRFTCE